MLDLNADLDEKDRRIDGLIDRKVRMMFRYK
jgi:hypothetical protein